LNANLLRTGRFEGELKHRKASGEASLLDVSAFSMLNESGEVLCNVEIERDITERRRTQEALIAADKLTSMGRLAATVAHEINNPLNSVMNLLYLIQQDSSVGEKCHEYARTAQEELRRVAHVCHETLAFYRESHLPQELNLSELLDGVLSMLSVPLRTKSIQVERRYSENIQVRGYCGELHQVFANLIDNAIAAIGENGRIIVRASECRDARSGRRGVRVLVVDNGSGIERGNLAKVFEPFFTTKGQKGTGLGLWVCEGVVRRHGGSIRVHSSTRAGRSGSAFSVYLPVAESIGANNG
jgi:signal transduction histidine kinase